MKNQNNNGEESCSTDYHYRRSNSAALESLRVVLGAIILLILVPLFFSLGGGSLSLFGLILAVEFLGVFWGVYKFIRPPKGLPPLIPANYARPSDRRNELKKAA